MTVPTSQDIARVDVEHGLTEARGGEGFVKIRVTSDQSDVVMLGQVDPDTARQLATDLMNVAARAEYEQDFWRESHRSGVPENAVGKMLAVVRAGESRRMEGKEPS